MSRLGWKARRRWSLAVLLIGLPVYVVLAVSLVGLFERPSLLLELGIYVGLGILWILPLRFVFLGVARDEPGAPAAGGEARPRGQPDA